MHYKGLMNVNYHHFWPICPLQTPNSCPEDVFKENKNNKCHSHTHSVFHSPVKVTSPSPLFSLPALKIQEDSDRCEEEGRMDLSTFLCYRQTVNSKNMQRD